MLAVGPGKISPPTLLSDYFYVDLENIMFIQVIKSGGSSVKKALPGFGSTAAANSMGLILVPLKLFLLKPTLTQQVCCRLGMKGNLNSQYLIPLPIVVGNEYVSS